MGDPIGAFEHVEFDNGLHAYISQWPGRPWQAIGFVVHAGSRQNPVGKEGLAHFVEHLVSHNQVVDQRVVESFFRQHGGSVDLGTTAPESTDFFCQFPARMDVMRQALGLFGQMLLAGKLALHMVHERRVILRELSQLYNGYNGAARDAELEAVLSADVGPVCRSSAVGTPESIKSITRRDLQAFYDKYYTPANISIVILGGLSVKTSRKLLWESAFTLERAGERVPLPERLHSVPPLPATVRAVKPTDVDPSHTVVFEQYARLPYYPNRWAPVVFARLLSRRLEEVVRAHHGWAYDMSAAIESQSTFDLLTIRSPSMAAKAMPFMQAIIDDCIRQIARRSTAFEAERQHLLGELRLYDVSGRELCSLVMDTLRKQQRLIPLREQTASLHQLSLHDIQVMARAIKQSGWWQRVEHF